MDKMSKKLTITASNRNRLDLNSLSSQWFLKSIQWQTYTDFELLIADGGSDNYEEIKNYFESSKDKIPMRIVQHKIGIPFERAKLNNVGVRNAYGEYIMATDVDMLLGKEFVAQLIKNIGENVLVESRTMYWKADVCNRIYNGELDPYNNIEACRISRLKKRTSAGGCQCMHREKFNALSGYNENMIGWGSEDVELLKRASLMGLKVVWLGETPGTINLFHQHHAKKDIEFDLQCQEKNKKIFNSTNTILVNPVEWGGKPTR